MFKTNSKCTGSLMAIGVFSFFSQGGMNAIANAVPYIALGVRSREINIGGLAIHRSLGINLGGGFDIGFGGFILSPSFNLSRDYGEDDLMSRITSLGLSKNGMNFGVDLGYDFGKLAILFNISDTVFNFEHNNLASLFGLRTNNITYGSEIRANLDKILSIGVFLRIANLELKALEMLEPYLRENQILSYTDRLFSVNHIEAGIRLIIHSF